MSAIVLLPVILPGAAAAWPVIATAAAATAAAMGFAAAGTESSVKATLEVELQTPTEESVSEEVGLGEELVFAREGCEVIFARDAAGKVSVRVRGENKTEAELREIGERMSGGLVQQYAYHRIITELKDRDLNVVNEETDEDGTVRLKVRVFQG